MEYQKVTTLFKKRFMAPVSGSSIRAGTVKGAAWCLPGKGQGRSLYEFSATAEFINGRVTFFWLSPKHGTFYLGELFAIQSQRMFATR